MYKNVDQNFTEVDKNNLLSKALAFYQEAERKAKSSDDKSSAAKNIGKGHQKNESAKTQHKVSASTENFPFRSFVLLEVNQMCAAAETFQCN